MRKHLLAAGIAAATLIPAAALAQPCRTENNRMVGTVAGAGIGALAGSAVAGKGNKTEGAVLGGVLGAVIGNQVSKGHTDNCAQAYGYYDSNGRWHANAIPQASATGYYDRNGNWIAGAPNGYYGSDGRWMSASSRGYYDRSGYWVPPSTSGYYDINGRWVVAAPSAGAAGYNASYDSRSFWAGAPADVRQREAWLERRIHRGQRDGSLSRREADRALGVLADIRRDERRMSRNGLDPREEAQVQARLDDLGRTVRWDRRDGDRY
jgi:hypothetical protein